MFLGSGKTDAEWSWERAGQLGILVKNLSLDIVTIDDFDHEFMLLATKNLQNAKRITTLHLVHFIQGFESTVELKEMPISQGDKSLIDQACTAQEFAAAARKRVLHWSGNVNDQCINDARRIRAYLNYGIFKEFSKIPGLKTVDIGKVSTENANDQMLLAITLENMPKEIAVKYESFTPRRVGTW